uniref:Pectinesterase inhibitor domain-containing protein n=1 Tax=Setaria italica TaxID=4555 RepID=K3XSF1_SETIT
MYLRCSRLPANVNATELAQLICARSQNALDLASKVMDIAGLGLHATEISQHTTNQMVRACTSVFCNVAADAYHKRVKMETIISFLDALRGLGAVCHILVEGIVAKLEDGPIRNIITSYMDKHSQEFDNKVNNLKDEFKLATEIHAHK